VNGNIEAVIERLGTIVTQAREQRSRLGYFAALYRRMTVEIRNGIRDGAFRDPALVERLDVAFAARYFDAYDAWHARRPVTHAWHVAFDAANSSTTVALQHLLLGINAHVNLDLGIVTAHTVAVQELDAFRDDFYQVNLLIRGLIGEVQERISNISPGFRWLDRLGGSLDETLFDFSMVQAREFAWRFARELSPLNERDRENRITRVDLEVAARGRFVLEPGPFARVALCAFRLLEESDVVRVIDALSLDTESQPHPHVKVA
jgi:Family of unknown function (DUF5995)